MIRTEDIRKVIDNANKQQNTILLVCFGHLNRMDLSKLIKRILKARRYRKKGKDGLTR